MVDVISRYKFLDHILEDNNKKSQSKNKYAYPREVNFHAVKRR